MSSLHTSHSEITAGTLLVLDIVADITTSNLPLTNQAAHYYYSQTEYCPLDYSQSNGSAAKTVSALD